jgi:membrane protein DedA with SNARE-associated domain
MNLSDLVAQYGYAAVFAGSLLEGETVLLLAGIAVHRELLSFIGVVGVAFVGGTLGDQLLFRLGRRWGGAILQRSPFLSARALPVDRLIKRHENALIVGVRFMYGLRLIGPFVIGMSQVSASKFALLNLLGAAIWAPLVVGVGYLFGETISWLITDLGHYEALGLLLVIAVVALVVLVRRRTRDKA